MLLLLVVRRVLVSSSNSHNLRQQRSKSSWISWSAGGVERVLCRAGRGSLQPVLRPKDRLGRGCVRVDVPVVLPVALARHLPRDRDDGGVGQLENPVHFPSHHVQCSLRHQASALKQQIRNTNEDGSKRRKEKGNRDERHTLICSPVYRSPSTNHGSLSAISTN